MFRSWFNWLASRIWDFVSWAVTQIFNILYWILSEIIGFIWWIIEGVWGFLWDKFVEAFDALCETWGIPTPDYEPLREYAEMANRFVPLDLCLSLLSTYCAIYAAMWFWKNKPRSIFS